MYNRSCYANVYPHSLPAVWVTVLYEGVTGTFVLFFYTILGKLNVIGVNCSLIRISSFRLIYRIKTCLHRGNAHLTYTLCIIHWIQMQFKVFTMWWIISHVTCKKYSQEMNELGIMYVHYIAPHSTIRYPCSMDAHSFCLFTALVKCKRIPGYFLALNQFGDTKYEQ